MGEDPFDLQRFVTAQAPTSEIALVELRTDRKRSHWIWFIFPNCAASADRRPPISTLDEARAYLAHPVLGPRLDRATRAALSTETLSVHQIFGSPDDRKLHSSMTLFALASSGASTPFREALDRWFVAIWMAPR